uniref:Mitochondrial intermediate peptidase n=1 Tax=Flammulina velutipes TaxID=38945 RepID=F1CZK5_FLAVE|nr:putative mitochondrial intermediate peptidase [Flammulina velutipes]
MIARVSRNVLPKPSAPFRFRGCLFEKDSFHRGSRRFSTETRPTIPASADDRSLVALFDHPRYTPSGNYSSRTGLFGHTSLAHPRGLISLANATYVRAQMLTNRILNSRASRDEMFKVVKNLDRLSDLLCGVIDLAETVRNSHPDRAWVEAANTAYETLCEFMNVLNTHVGLYEVRAVLADPEIVKSLSPEAHTTALIFWHDFEHSAINLRPEQREKFVSLSTDILVLGRQFLADVNAPRPPASIKPSELSGLKDQGMGVRLKLQARFTQRDLLVYPGSLQAQMIMHSAPAEEARRRVYMASNSSTPEQIEVLEAMLHRRAEVARLVGRESYGHLVLDNKMSKSPENVSHFLNALMDYTRPYARSAIGALSQRKQAHLKTPPHPTIQAWDRDFYCPPEPPSPPIPLPPMTVGTVFMGLSRLFRHLYGITFRPAETSPGEVWHPDVHKLEVVDEEKGIIGWVYADLFARRGKGSGAAHYTVRCSRRTDDDDAEADNELSGLVVNSHDVRQSVEFEAAKKHRLPGQPGVYQLPLVVLICEFRRPNSSDGATCLEWHEVNTLFHEMGHAMHSMLGRTEYHNVAGTRCATDFVELPSLLMEHFLTSPDVLCLFDINSTSTVSQGANNAQDPCHAIDTYNQILLSAVDQRYHSSIAISPNFDSTKEYANLVNTRGLIPYVEGTSYQTQFGHLYGYGATYYSYLFDRAIASRVWSHVFAKDPLNRGQGEKFKDEVLKYGGGKDPWKMVSTILAKPELENGDADAMREVGQWRIEDEMGLSGLH